MMSRYLYFLFLALMVDFSGSSVFARTWTSVDGRKIEAKMVSCDLAEESVVIRNDQGKEFTLSFDKLSPADVNYLRALKEEGDQDEAVQEEVIKKAKTNENNAGEVTSHISSGEHKTPYHVYYPKSWDGSATLPMMILFSPSGGGKGILKKFQEAADGVGWVLVGCDRFKNGMEEELGNKMFAELLPEIEKIVTHDPEWLYMGGFSGGAMRSYGYSVEFDRPWKGVIACGGWLGGRDKADLDYPKKMRVAIVNGDQDKNANAWVGSDTRGLEKRRCKVEEFPFAGGHKVAPSEVLLEAMRWVNERS